MKAVFHFALISSLFISPWALAERDSSIQGKKVEIDADGKSSTVIVNTGDGKVIGKTGDLIKQLDPSTKKTNNGDRNSNISASENLTIKATNHGTVIVLTGDGTVVYEANKEAVEKLGVAQKSLASFFAIMQVEEVPVTDWGNKLSEIAESFKGLKEKLASIQTSDKIIIALKQQADEAIDNGQFLKARELLDKAEQQAIDSHVENRLLTAAEIAATKGALANTQLQYETMGEAYENAANKMAALGEQHHEKWSEYLYWAGWGYSDAGLYAKTEPLYKKALALREEHLPEEHTDIALSLNNLANLYRRQGRYEDAEPLYQRSLAISEKALGKDHPDVATTLNNLAGLYESQGRYEDAEPLYQRSLAISEKALGKDHPSVATTLNNLGTLSFHQNKFEQATTYLERALTIIQKTLGDDHPNVKTMQANLDYVRQQTTQ